MSYNKVIPLLKESLDWKSICFQIAAEHPDVFLEAFTSCNTDLVRNSVIQTLKGDRMYKISAIKTCRELTNMDLKQAKEYVESIIEELGI